MTIAKPFNLTPENNKFLISTDNLKEHLSQELISAYNKITVALVKIPPKVLKRDIVANFETNDISAINVLSYLIGWANMLISWYDMGKQNKVFTMPGEGFSKWEYKKISQHFYKKYGNNSLEQQLLLLQNATYKIISMIEAESRSGDIDRVGVWNWCTIKSGKKWPLRKWIVVNSLSPYKRALSRLKIALKN